MTTEQKLQQLERGIELVMPAAKEALKMTRGPDAEGKHGYITLYRLLQGIAAKSRGQAICTALALARLGYDKEALCAASEMAGL